MLRITSRSFSLLCFLFISALLHSQTEVSGIIEASETWDLTGSPYIVTGNIIVREEATLTITPGVIVKFDGLRTLTVDGRLSAQGTNSQPIIFTSIKDDIGGDSNGDGGASSPQDDEWISVIVREASVGSVLEWCHFRHGGQLLDGALVIESSSTTVQDCIFTRNAVGLKVLSRATPGVNRNEFSSNLLTPIKLGLGASFSSFSGNVFSDNQFRGIGLENELFSGSYSLSVPQLEGLSNVPYVLYNNIIVDEGSQLTIDPGVVIKASSLNIFTVEGVLTARGNSASPIVFTSLLDDTIGGDTNTDGTASEASDDEWIGVVLASTSSSSVIEHCTFRHAGQLRVGALTVVGVNPIIRNNSFQRSRVGLKLREGANPSVDENRFTANTLTPIQVSLSSDFASFSNNQFSDNQYNGIGLEDETHSGPYTLSVPSLPGLSGVPYVLFENLSLEEGSSLTIAEGVVIKTTSLNRITIEGSLNATGAPNAPIVFTSILDDEIGGDTNTDGLASSASNDEWLGLILTGADTPSRFEHTIFRHAGQIGGAGLTADSRSPVLTNCIFTKNRLGLKVDGSARPSVTDCSFTDNSSVPLELSLSTTFASFSGNQFSDNGLNGIGIVGGDYNATYSLSPTELEGLVGAPYVITNNVTIEDGGSLTIEAGVVLKFTQLQQLSINGSLNASGTSEAPVYFTAVQDDAVGGDTNNDGQSSSPAAGRWRNVSISGSNTSSRLGHCIFRYGSVISEGVLEISNATVELDHIEFVENRNGLSVADDLANVTVDSTLFCSQQRSGIRSFGGNLTIRHSTFTKNGEFDIENLGAQTITARENWWDFSTFSALQEPGTPNVSSIFDALDDPNSGPVDASSPLQSLNDFTSYVDGFSVFLGDNTLDFGTFSWSFGDEQTSNQVNPAHTYDDFGAYEVCLNPTDCETGGTGNFCKEVIVPGVSSLFPNISTNQGVYIGILRGAGFSPDDIITLTRAGQVDIVADTLILGDATTVKVFFTFEGADLGAWTLNVNGRNINAELPEALTLEEDRPAIPFSFIEGRTRIRSGRTTMMRVGVTNPGNTIGFGVPIYMSISPEIDVKVQNEVLQEDLDSEVLEFTQDNFIKFPQDGDTSLVGHFLIPQLLPGETFFLELMVTANLNSDSNNISVTTGLPWFSTEDLRDAGLFYKNGSFEVPACLDCGFSIAEFTPGPAGCAIGFLNTALNFIVDGASIALGRGPSAGKAMFNAGFGFLASSACLLSGGSVSVGRIKAISEFIDKTADLKTGAEGIGSCLDCLEDLGFPTDFDFGSSNSYDPNDKVGPSGSGDLHYVLPPDQFHYTVYFENLDSATAPASEVFITDVLDTTLLDPGTVEFIGFGFDDREFKFPIPITDKSFVTDLNLNPDKDIILRVTGDVNTSNGTMLWTFRSFDPVTMTLSEDIDLGFLPPNVQPPEGEGYVQFSVRPRGELTHLTEIANGASIVFDNNPPIITPTWINVIDVEPPSSEVQDFTEVPSQVRFPVSWGGNDAPGAGILYYDIYVSENSADYEIWQFRVEDSSAEFVGNVGSSYEFYSIATDSIGNREAPPSVPDAVVDNLVSTEPTGNITGYLLHQNVPNPFGLATKIGFTLPVPSDVSLEILDASGKQVYLLASSWFTAGRHSVNWSPHILPNGTYYYRIKANGFTRTRKMVLQR